MWSATDDRTGPAGDVNPDLPPYDELPDVIGVRAVPRKQRFIDEVCEAMERQRDAAYADVDDETLVHQVRVQAAEIAAATSRWLDALRELVKRGIWAEQGASSPAQWLAWAVGMANATARAHVTVALRLEHFRKVDQVFAMGLLSYSQVRAIVRTQHPQIEVELIRYATYATGEQLERIIGQLNRGHDALRVDEVEAYTRRSVAVREHEDDLAELVARLPIEDALRLRDVLQHRAGVERGRQLQERSRMLDAGEVDEEDLPDVPSVSAIAADLLIAAVEAWVDQEPDDASGQDRHLLVLHVDAERLDAARDADLAVPVWDRDDRRVPGMSARTIRRMLCSASWVAVAETVDGEVVEMTGSTRAVPPAMRRLLHARDRHCRFTGCLSRRGLHAHHIVHVEDGGPTVPSNLVLLCGFHHRFVHAKDVTIHHDGRGHFRFQLSGADAPMEPVLAMLGADPDAIERRRETEGHRPPPPMATFPHEGPLDLDACVYHLYAEIGRAQPPASAPPPSEHVLAS